MRRYSIRTLMALVVVSAVGLAALRGADATWAGLLLLTALAAVGAAVLGAAILRGRERAWWAGFAFFGGGYLALTFGPWLSESFEPHLGTTHLLRHFYGRMIPAPAQTEAEIETLRLSRSELADQVRRTMRVTRSFDDPAIVAIKKALATVDQKLGALKSAPRYDDFRQVGHALFALLAGLLGTVVAAWFYRRRERIDASSGPA